MAKKVVKIFLSPKEIERLKDKASAAGFTKRGAISHYIEKIANEPIIFLDKKIMKVLKALK